MQTYDKLCHFFVQEINSGRIEYLHISFDIDTLDPAYALATGTPEPDGFTTREMFPMIHRLCAECNVVGMELVEVAPPHDPGNTTALNGLRIIQEAITGLAMRKQGLAEPHYLDPRTSDQDPVPGQRTDVLLIAAAALMGKDNLQYLFSKLGSWFTNLVKWNQVSPQRYKLGLWLMCLSIAVTLGLFYFLPESLRVGNQPGWGFYVTVGADIVFIISFFVLGAEFWAKIQALFQYNARVVVEETDEASA
jgi:hypothetical protein